MKRIKNKSIDFTRIKTNRDMLDKDVLRYCEDYYHYLYHIVNYFNEKLNDYEKRILLYLINRIEFFLNDAPSSELTYVFVGRYSRLLKRLKKLRDEQV